jgi:Skp family chaperone for outer membrane proteins
VHHFKNNRMMIMMTRALAASVGCALFLHAVAVRAEHAAPGGSEVGVADVGRLLSHYRKTQRVRAALESQKMSEDYKQKRMEVERLEQELEHERFWFFPRRKEAEIRARRDELHAVAAQEAERLRAREKEAIDDLMADLQKAAEAAASRRQLSIVFDTTNPHILFLGIHAGENGEITDEALETLNSTNMGNAF